MRDEEPQDNQNRYPKHWVIRSRFPGIDHRKNNLSTKPNAAVKPLKEKGSSQSLLDKPATKFPIIQPNCPIVNSNLIRASDLILEKKRLAENRYEQKRPIPPNGRPSAQTGRRNRIETRKPHPAQVTPASASQSNPVIETKPELPDRMPEYEVRRELWIRAPMYPQEQARLLIRDDLKKPKPVYPAYLYAGKTLGLLATVPRQESTSSYPKLPDIPPSRPSVSFTPQLPTVESPDWGMCDTPDFPRVETPDFPMTVTPDSDFGIANLSGASRIQRSNVCHANNSESSSMPAEKCCQGYRKHYPSNS